MEQQYSSWNEFKESKGGKPSIADYQEFAKNNRIDRVYNNDKSKQLRVHIDRVISSTKMVSWEEDEEELLMSYFLEYGFSGAVEWGKLVFDRTEAAIKKYLRRLIKKYDLQPPIHPNPARPEKSS